MSDFYVFLPYVFSGLILLFSTIILWKYQNKVGKLFVQLLVAIMIFSAVFLLIYSQLLIKGAHVATCNTDVISNYENFLENDDFPLTSEYSGFLVDFNQTDSFCDYTEIYKLCFDYNSTGNTKLLRAINGDNFLEEEILYLPVGVGNACISFEREGIGCDDRFGIVCTNCNSTSKLHFFSDFNSQDIFRTHLEDFSEGFEGSSASVYEENPLAIDLHLQKNCDYNALRYFGYYIFLMTILFVWLGVYYSLNKFESEVTGK